MTCGFVKCGKPLPARQGRGRPRKFCGDPCRMAQHNAKVAAERKATHPYWRWNA